MPLRRRAVVLTTVSALTVVTALVVVTILVLVNRAAPAKPATSATATPAAPPTSAAPAGPLRSPFTGERVNRLGPVLVVKIDNVVDARPPTGLTRADVVYLLPVEGGLSRIFAVFSSHFPHVIGPVRSTREDDLELLRQFGRPAFAYSGAQSHLLPYIHRARIVDLYAGLVGGYFRDPNRFIPHNLYANARLLLAEGHRASRARDIGFRFGRPPPGGRRIRSLHVAYPAASFGFRWSAHRARWLVSMDGAAEMSTEGGQLGAPTVVIQYTKVSTSRFLERGSRPPFAVSTGSGTALVLRGGKVYRVRWSRPHADGGTTFTTPAGRRMTFARGQVWVVLIAAH